MAWRPAEPPPPHSSDSHTQTNTATTVPVSQLTGPSQPAVLQPSVEPAQPTPQVLLTKVPSASSPCRRGKHLTQLSLEMEGWAKGLIPWLPFKGPQDNLFGVRPCMWRVCSPIPSLPTPHPTASTKNKPHPSGWAAGCLQMRALPSYHSRASWGLCLVLCYSGPGIYPFFLTSCVPAFVPLPNTVNLVRVVPNSPPRCLTVLPHAPRCRWRA